MGITVVHPGGWSRWSQISLPVGPTPTGGVSPEVFFWGTPRVGQGFSRISSGSSFEGPVRAGSLLVWVPPTRVGGSPLGGWLFRVGTLLGYF